MKKLIFFTLLFCFAGLTQQPVFCMDEKRQKVASKTNICDLPFDCWGEICRFVKPYEMLHLLSELMKTCKHTKSVATEIMKTFSFLEATIYPELFVKIFELRIKNFNFFSNNKITFMVDLSGPYLISSLKNFNNRLGYPDLGEVIDCLFKDEKLNVTELHITPSVFYDNRDYIFSINELFPNLKKLALVEVFNVEYCCGIHTSRSNMEQKHLSCISKLEQLETLSLEFATLEYEYPTEPIIIPTCSTLKKLVLIGPIYRKVDTTNLKLKSFVIKNEKEENFETMFHNHHENIENSIPNKIKTLKIKHSHRLEEIDYLIKEKEITNLIISSKKLNFTLTNFTPTNFTPTNDRIIYTLHLYEFVNYLLSKKENQPEPRYNFETLTFENCNIDIFRKEKVESLLQNLLPNLESKKLKIIFSKRPALCYEKNPNATQIRKREKEEFNSKLKGLAEKIDEYNSKNTNNILYNFKGFEGYRAYNF